MKTLLGAAALLGALALAGPSAACPVNPECPQRHAHAHRPAAKPKPAKPRPAPPAPVHYGPAAPGYGVSHGAGYGYTHGSPIAHAGYRTVQIETTHYDSGWVELPGAAAYSTYGHAGGYERYTDTGWRGLGGVPYPLAQHCPHPGAVVCFPAVHTGPVTFVPLPAYDAGLTVAPELFHGGAVGGVGYEPSYGAGYGYGGGGTVVIQSGADASAYASARASARAQITARPRPGRPSGHAPCCAGKRGH